MSNINIVFSPRAKQRLADIAEYMHNQGISNDFILEYLSLFEIWLCRVLGEFPESGVLMAEYGNGIRRISYQKYSFIYRIKNTCIEILTIYRENLP